MLSAKNTALFRQSITGWNFRILHGINYIDEHITEDITPEMMAEHFNYSRDYFRKAFQDDFGMGLSAYISQRKIQKAARELRQGVKVASLAKKYGFKSRNGFDKAFRKAFCTSPSKYAKANTEVVDLNQFYSEYKDKMKVSFMDVDGYQNGWLDDHPKSWTGSRYTGTDSILAR